MNGFTADCGLKGAVIADNRKSRCCPYGRRLYQRSRNTKMKAANVEAEPAEKNVLTIAVNRDPDRKRFRTFVAIPLPAATLPALSSLSSLARMVRISSFKARNGDGDRTPAFGLVATLPCPTMEGS